MGQNGNASSMLVQVGSAQPGTAELTFIFKYKTLGCEGGCVLLCLSFLFSNPSTASSMEASRALLPLHSLDRKSVV